jgi:hypothetical protein
LGDISEPEEVDIEALLARMAPPGLPSDVLASSPNLTKLLRDLDPVATVATLAGLQTEPQFQANLVRLEWAIRLVLALARGTRKPSRRDLHQLLNVALEKARVNLLEDPIEDFFIEPVPTTVGDFLLLSGTWEQAAFYTETLLSAFGRLPNGEPRSRALHWAIALLRLSDALVRRADLERRQIGGGDPKGRMQLPDQLKLRSVAKRVMFTWGELEQLGFERRDFYPYTLSIEQAAELLHAPLGNSVLDFRPLICLPEGILVASPTNLTTAVRAVLIDAATQGGLGEALQRRVLDTQAEAVWDSSFAKLEGFPVRRVGRFLVRTYGRKVSAGRFVSYIQTMDSFDGWPESAFGDVRDEPELAALICEEARAAKSAFERQGYFVEGLTVCFLGGWGAGRSLVLPNDADLAEWEFVLLSPGDASAIARCEGGTVRDLWRLQKQQTLVEQQGFQLLAINGLLNLFHWWRLTDHALVPPGWGDVVPPAMVTIGTDYLLAARREGFEALDRRALPHPNGTHKIVTRLDPKGYLGGALPIYGSLADVRGAELVGGVLSGPLTFWIHLESPRSDPRSYDNYETWRAALHWMELLLPAFWRRYGEGLTAKPFAISLVVEWPDTQTNRLLRDDEIPSTLTVGVDDDGQRARLTLKPEWQFALRRSDNVAEVELATALLRILAQDRGVDIPVADLRAFVSGVAGSPDLRWRHAFIASHAIDVLKYHGLLERMRAIPISAGALVKCGLAFLTRAREDGLKIEGKSACGDFLFRQTTALTAQLRERVAAFNKQSFVELALTAFQAAQGELRDWEVTARATRAIHGVREDYRGSLERTNKAYGVVRSTSMLVEVANAEGQADDGLELGDMDFAELQALSLLILQLADVIPIIMGDWVEPEIGISPTGDVLTDHRFAQRTLQRSAERRHEAERVRQSDAYDSRFANTKDPRALPGDFRDAIAAEYGADSEVVLDLAFAAARLAGNSKTGVLVLPRDELISALEGLDGMKGQCLAPLIDRLTMPVRRGWDDVPPGYSKADFDLSRFDRRPSLIAKPIIALTSDANPRLVVAPAVIERTMFHNLGGAMTGALQNEFWTTREMRAFSSASGMRTGLEFNETVAKHIEKFGLRTWPSAKPAWALNCKATPEVEQLGDIDVLAVSGDGSRVWVIEVKDLKLCRTMGEIARRLSEFRGRRNEKGQPDKMLRHLRRVAYLREHSARLAGRLGLRGEPQISGALIVRSPQPMEHVQVGSSDAQVVMFDDIETMPWREGWTASR